MLDRLLLLTLAGTLLSLAVFLSLRGAAWLSRGRWSGRRTPGRDRLPDRHLLVRGRRRSYHLYVPETLSGTGRIPLVLAFHGGGGNGLRFRAATGFDRVADRFGFALAYPNAVRYWNDGRKGTSRGPDDLLFVRKLIDHLVKRERIDPGRIYATGQSNGGLLTIRLACELADRIAAFAPVLASMPVEFRPKCRPCRPVPILFINGTADRLIPWEGGDIPRGATLGAGGEVISVPDTIRFWRTHNGCEDAPLLQRVQDRDKADGMSAQFLRFRGCAEGGDLAVIKVHGGGHVWPGTRLHSSGRRAELTGEASADFDASVVVWKFFEGRVLP